MSYRIFPRSLSCRPWLCCAFLSLLLALYTVDMSAQSDTQMRRIYTQAENDYRIGRIEQARDTLVAHFQAFKGNERQNALRLIALSYLARFDTEQTTHYVTQLLENDPYYTPSPQDPPAFVDIVNSIKSGMTATITTASSQAESLAEAPVPTTLITEDMIRDCGGRNLQEVLAAYVPGMNLIDCNDDINISMRGIYSNTQEKILIMLNGHRLNSYATNTAAPDFSISLEKVKQIEVLRGPASSLYGGVALTSVVNIITKQGADVDGLYVKAGAGNHRQLRGDVLFGKRYFDLDILLWGSIYHNTGEWRDVSNVYRDEDEFSMPVDSTRIGRIGDRPTYDFGLQLSWKGLHLLYDSHFSQVIAPFTLSTLALSYDRDRYCTHNGIAPSFATSARHADLNYQFAVRHSNFKFGVTYENADLTRYQVINDEPVENLGSALGLPDELSSMMSDYGGLSRYVNGQEHDLGVYLKGNYNYAFGSEHKGALGYGLDYNFFRLNDIRYLVGYNFDLTSYEDPVMREAGKGSEHTADGYIQLKHKWRSLILNAGLRYDYKYRYDASRVNELSPRAALILLKPRWNAKLSYSKSFVDAPYIYRKANILTELLYDNSSTPNVDAISPERVHSLQLSFSGTNWIRGLDFELNGFYNSASNLIMTRVLTYENAGNNKTAGLELMASYRTPHTLRRNEWQTPVPRFTANFNLTWTHTFKANLMDLGSSDDDVSSMITTDIDANNNTPAIVANLVLALQATPRLRLHTHLLVESKQSSYNTDLVHLLKYVRALGIASEYVEAQDYETAQNYVDLALDLLSNVNTKKDMPARAIVNIGAQYDIKRFSLSFDIHNLFNTRYYRSGMNTNLIPQQGTWFMGTVAYHL